MTTQPESGSAAGMISLRELIDQYGPLTPASALLVFRESLAGLAAAQERGAVYQDYGPDGILVAPDGSSRLVSPSGRGGSRGELTPYLAPEQRHGAPPSEATNLYAATAVFFECLTGSVPSPEAIRRFRRRELPVSARIGPATDSLTSLMAQGMAASPLDRPASAAGLLTEVDAVAAAAYGPGWPDQGRYDLSVETAPAQAPPPGRHRAGAGRGPATRLRRPRRAVQVAVATAVAVSVMAVAGIAAAESGAFGRQASHSPLGIDWGPLAGASSAPASAGAPTAADGATPGSTAALSARSGHSPAAPTSACPVTASCPGLPPGTAAATDGTAPSTAGTAPASGTAPTPGGAPASIAPPAGLDVRLTANQPPGKVVSCGSAPPGFEVIAEVNSDQTIDAESYHWVRPDGTATAPGIISMGPDKTTSASTVYTPPSDNFSGSDTLVFTSPVQGTWTIQLSLTCTTTPPASATPAPPPLVMGVPSSGSGYVIAGTYNKPFADTFTATGGVGPYTWAAVGLPPGLTINPASGTVGGTATAVGDYIARITVRDSTTPGDVAALQWDFSFGLPTQ
jgi:hypothetical protein